ncbi:MAG: TCR/Tet family MFS transporter [Hydrogenophilaceae bacterium]|jgi:DHA1 family tetracycline resistance protein-like MFS transporter|nr:TCR/Tet family MFS transporter [Hydrogenophilaceae bacterium]
MEQEKTRRALAFILFAVLIDTIGFAIVLPVLPDYLMALSGVSKSVAAAQAGWLLFTFAALQFLCGPVLGNLSDRFGRRPVLLASMAAFGVNYILMALAPTLAWLFVGRAVAGIAGAIYAPANAYVADITEPKERARRFGYVGAAFGLGFILGPALGGLIGQLDPRAPFYAAGILALANFAFGWFALPESLPKALRRPFDWRRANPLSALLALRGFGNVLPLVFVMFLYILGFQVYPATWTFYAALKFDWSPLLIGAALAVSGLFMALVQTLLVGRIVGRIGERGAVIIGMSFAVLGMVAYVLIDHGWMVFAVSALASLQALAGPSLNALATSRVPRDQQGALQGAIASLNALGAIIGPLALTQALSAATAEHVSHPFPGAAFALAALICGAALLIFLAVERRAPTPAPAA